MYSIDDYERPSVAADTVVFGIDRSGSDSKSKNLELKILLIRRGEDPFLGRLSLPGGFLRKGETIEQTAMRELSEEAGVSDPKLIQFGIYSQTDRDPRGWIISCAFLALTDTVTLSTAEDSDAADAQWLSFSFSGDHREASITIGHDITINYRNGTPLESPLAFDHAQIIFDAFLRLRDEAVYNDIIFDLMPPLFAISDLQKPFEAITGIHTTPQNFRKKISPKIEETDQFDQRMAHRPSKLYRRKDNES